MSKEKDRKTVDTLSCGTCLYRPSSRGGFDVLLVRPNRDRYHWGIPKGHINTDETVEECAVRETIEETGYKPILQEPLPEVCVSHSNERKVVKSFLATIDPTASIGARDDENFEVSWFHYDDLPSLHRYQISLLTSAVVILKTR